MTATVIDGKAIAAQVRGEVAERVSALASRGVVPGFVDLLVGVIDPRVADGAAQ